MNFFNRSKWGREALGLLGAGLALTTGRAAEGPTIRLDGAIEAAGAPAMLALTIDGRSCGWQRVGASAAGYLIKNYDPERGEATLVDGGGRTIVVALPEGRVKPAAPVLARAEAKAVLRGWWTIRNQRTGETLSAASGRSQAGQEQAALREALRKIRASGTPESMVVAYNLERKARGVAVVAESMKLAPAPWPWLALPDNVRANLTAEDMAEIRVATLQLGEWELQLAMPERKRE